MAYTRIVVSGCQCRSQISWHILWWRPMSDCLPYPKIYSLSLLWTLYLEALFPFPNHGGGLYVFLWNNVYQLFKNYLYIVTLLHLNSWKARDFTCISSLLVEGRMLKGRPLGYGQPALSRIYLSNLSFMTEIQPLIIGTCTKLKHCFSVWQVAQSYWLLSMNLCTYTNTHTFPREIRANIESLHTGHQWQTNEMASLESLLVNC